MKKGSEVLGSGLKGAGIKDGHSAVHCSNYMYFHIGAGAGRKLPVKSGKKL
jgi:hypothetical protein